MGGVSQSVISLFIVLHAWIILSFSLSPSLSLSRTMVNPGIETRYKFEASQPVDLKLSLVLLFAIAMQKVNVDIVIRELDVLHSGKFWRA